MKFGSKVALVVGAVTGYVLGARAGRDRYEQIADRAEQVWNSKLITKQRNNVVELIDSYVPRAITSTVKGIGQIACGLGSMVFGDGARPKKQK